MQKRQRGNKKRTKAKAESETQNIEEDGDEVSSPDMVAVILGKQEEKPKRRSEPHSTTEENRNVKDAGTLVKVQRKEDDKAGSADKGVERQLKKVPPPETARVSLTLLRHEQEEQDGRNSVRPRKQEKKNSRKPSGSRRRQRYYRVRS